MQEVAVSDRRTDRPKRRSVAGSALRTMRGHNRSRRERPADSDADDAPVGDESGRILLIYIVRRIGGFSGPRSTG